MSYRIPLVIFLQICLSGIGISQINDGWSDPVTITDSTSYNSNPELAPAYDFGFDLFYEKKLSIDSPPDIFSMYIEDMEENALLQSDSFTFRNPKFYEYNYESFLLFESNMNGNFDIYALELLDYGIIGDTIQLTSTSDNEKSMSINQNYFDPDLIVWESMGKIKVAELNIDNGDLSIINESIIDSINCSNPQFDIDIFYQKLVNDEIHIYKSKFDIFEWGDPQTVYAVGDNTDLTISKCMIEDNEYPIALWGNDGNIMYSNVYDENVEEIVHPAIDSAFQMSCFQYFIFGKSNFDALIAFVEGQESMQDIFIQDYYYGDNPITVNISEDTIKDSNPKLCIIDYNGWKLRLFCIWQSHLNDFSLLKYSMKEMVVGKVNPTDMIQSIDIFPNPFTNRLHIDYYINKTENCTIELFSVEGKSIYAKEYTVSEVGFNNLSVDRAEIKNILPGIYFVKFSQGNYTEVQKVVYSN